MNFSLNEEFLIYGVLLVGLGALAHQLSPDSGPATLLVCVVGGGVALLWAILGFRGFKQRRWPIATLILLNIALVIQASRVWSAVRVGSDQLKPAGVILVLLLCFGIVQLVNSLKASRRDE